MTTTDLPDGTRVRAVFEGVLGTVRSGRRLITTDKYFWVDVSECIAVEAVPDPIVVGRWYKDAAGYKHWTFLGPDGGLLAFDPDNHEAYSVAVVQENAGPLVPCDPPKET